MNWKDEIDKRHKGQSGFFKEIEQPKRKRKTITMKKGTLVFNEENGRGLVIKTSPSKSLIEVNFKHKGAIVVLKSSLSKIK